MKKIIALLLAVSMLAVFAACGNKPAVAPETEGNTVVEQVKDDAASTEETAKPEEDASKDAVTDKTPAEQPTEKPAEDKPTEKPSEDKATESAKTVGQILLNDFKAKAGSASSVLSLAEKLIANDIIPFMGGAMEVEPGLLAGFDNAQITGFKKGATFMPMMGSIAFVGYVFELEDGVNATDFIANLKKNANLRWNVCVEADEMVAGNVGNKVFFVMCPKQFEA